MITVIRPLFSIALALALLGQGAAASCLDCACCGPGSIEPSTAASDTPCCESTRPTSRDGWHGATARVHFCSCDMAPEHRPASVSPPAPSPRVDEAPAAIALSLPLPSKTLLPAASVEGSAPPGPSAQRLLCVYRC